MRRFIVDVEAREGREVVVSVLERCPEVLPAFCAPRFSVVEVPVMPPLPPAPAPERWVVEVTDGRNWFRSMTFGNTYFSEDAAWDDVNDHMRPWRRSDYRVRRLEDGEQ